MRRCWRALGAGVLAAGFLAWCGLFAGCAAPRAAALPAAGAPSAAIPEPPPHPTPPETEEMTAQGAVKSHFPDPGHRGLPPLFTWYRFPEATAYRLVLLDMDGKPVFEGDKTSENSAPFPEAWREQGPKAGIYFWQIVALNGRGEAVAKSPLRDFVYEP